MGVAILTAVPVWPLPPPVGVVVPSMVPVISPSTARCVALVTIVQLYLQGCNDSLYDFVDKNVVSLAITSAAVATLEVC